MRKTITLGLLALMFSLFASQVSADVEDCEDIKGEKKGLYGLCIAYWTVTNPKAQEMILANFNKNAGEDGPSMPGLFGCPCWDLAELGNTCSMSLGGGFADLDFLNGFALFNSGAVVFIANNQVGSCGYINGPDGISTNMSIDSDQALSCVADIEGLLSGAFCED